MLRTVSLAMLRTVSLATLRTVSLVTLRTALQRSNVKDYLTKDQP